MTNYAAADPTDWQARALKAEGELLSVCQREAATHARHDAKVDALVAERAALRAKLAEAEASHTSTLNTGYKAMVALVEALDVLRELADEYADPALPSEGPAYRRARAMLGDTNG